MNINSVSPSFTGFVTAHAVGDEKKHFINTSRIVGIDSYDLPAWEMKVNTLKYYNDRNELVTIESEHSYSEIEDYGEVPTGDDFVNIVSEVCAEADKTGKILSILV